jgi:hypothetical protein
MGTTGYRFSFGAGNIHADYLAVFRVLYFFAAGFWAEDKP